MTHNIEKNCCFTGHRDIPPDLLPEIRKNLEFELEKLYVLNGVKTFISGGAVGFDMIAAEMVVELKRRHPDVALIFALPCGDHSKKWSDSDISKLRILSLYADEVITLTPTYTRGCMHERNRFLVDNSLYCIAYCKKTSGGSYYTVNYAKKKNRTIIEI